MYNEYQQVPIQVDDKERNETRPVADLFNDIVELEPKIITDMVPDNGPEQKAAFLAGKIENPNNHYPNIETKNYAGNVETITGLAHEIAEHPELSPKFAQSYEDFADRYVKVNHLLELARDFKAAADDERDDIAGRYVELGSEIYGKPDETVFRTMLAEKLARIDKKELSGRAAEVKAELMELVVGIETGTDETRFKPSPETIEWMHNAVESLYGTLLEHVPSDVASFDAQAAKGVFESILREEFGEAAEGWVVDVEPAQSVNVKATEKRIVIPVDRDISSAVMRGLVVHEVGVHVLRAIQGANTDLTPLSSGLAGYLDSEEGLGVIMEQGSKGVYREAGVDHYVTIGLAALKQKSFREAFEIKWRLSALINLKAGTDLTDASIEKSRNTAYGAVMRTYRGTDALPMFKDLSYYNGAVEIWKYLEENRGDDLALSLLLMGKANPANDDNKRVLLETRTM